MPIAILLIIITIAGAIWFTVVRVVRGRNYGKEFEDFVREESEANMVRSKEINPELFYTPDISRLPVKPDDGGNTDSLPAIRQRDVLKRAQKKMIRLGVSMSNTELKLKYGTVNLEVISEYEENFFGYIYAINGWAESLLEEGREAEAETILKEGIAAGAETSKTYTLLADLYFKHGKREEMRDLYVSLEDKHMPAKEKTWRHINDYYNKMGL